MFDINIFRKIFCVEILSQTHITFYLRKVKFLQIKIKNNKHFQLFIKIL